MVSELALTLARIQFACNISFHILFPSITIGLSWILLYIRCKINYQEDTYRTCYQFWIKIFAISFAMGTVSGVTMSFQFGTNWPGFMEKFGNIAGPLLAYEVLTAFFIEASFLGIMLFAYKIVPKWLHILSITAVSIGSTLSAFWIISLNSWMHTPRGFHIENGIAIVDSWLEIVFNPSMPYRFIHTILASFLTAAFLIMGLSSIRLLKHSNDKATKLMLSYGTNIAAISIILQIIVGDLHGLNTLKHHPETIAAIEGLWETTTSAPLIILADIDSKKHKTNPLIYIPKMSSLILTHTFDGEVKGIKSFQHHPPVLPVFWGFRIMVGSGILMALVSIYGYFHMKKQKHPSKFYLMCCALMTFSGWIASLSGWYVTEIGRQPYLIHGFLKTADAVGQINAHTIASSLVMYVLVYSALLIAYIGTLIYMARK